MSKKFNNQCPECKSKDVIPIKYGMPGIEMQQDEHEGRIKLGGCGITEDANDRHCKECMHEWSKNTKYCTTCLDVVFYCKCAEEFFDNYNK